MRSPRDVFFAETWFEKEKALLNPLPKDSVRADSTVFEPPPQPKRKRIKKVGSQH
jgi:hypothetical protein